MIPSEDRIRRAILMLMYEWNNNTSAPALWYGNLNEYFEDELNEDSDLAFPYTNRRWIKAIRLAIDHLIDDGLVLNQEPGDGKDWKLSNEGIILGRELYINEYGSDPWAEQKTIAEHQQSKTEDKMSPKGTRNYYIIGSKYGDGNGNDVIPKIDEFIKNKCVAIGFLDWLDFSPYMGADINKVNEFVNANWTGDKPAWDKMQSYFRLLSQIKEGDIIAVKSHGAHNQLTIIAYAEVVKRNGSIYEHNEEELGHHIHVDFLDAGFYKKLGLTYAATIHKLTPDKDGEKFYKVFGWYAEEPVTNDEPEGAEVDVEGEIGEGSYNEKSEIPFERSAITSVTVNLIHNRIQNRFIKYLRKTYPNDITSGEKKRIDAMRETGNELFIYEIKPYESVYACIREGIGQLLDYSHQQVGKKEKRIFIVGPNKPEPHDLDFISAVRQVIQIPFGYIAFDSAASLAEQF